ncbi:ATP synthase complex assembly protein atp12 [Actinomortierella ambigua]|nr:ATP synthase complex assembly protein atp12 [Actinomortierella ambigua]
MFASTRLIARSCMRTSLGAVKSLHQSAVARDQMARAEVTGKRFWNTAGVQEMGDQIAVTLDKRVLKTPTGNPIILPVAHKNLAKMIAGEWQGQRTLLKSHSLPMTSLVARAIDGFINNEEGRQMAIERLIRYLDTDSICYQQDFPDSIVKAQDKHWKPILDWAKQEYGLDIQVSTGITFVPQTEETKQKLCEIVSAMSDLELAAFERATMTAKSFLTGLALVKRAVSVDDAYLASSLEVMDQIERWGEVEDSHDVDREFVKSQLASTRCIHLNSF